MSETMAGSATETPRTYPPGEWAIVELFGHTTLVGRIAEVERFGAKMLAIEPLFNDTLLPVILHGGSAIYRLTSCSAEIAFKKQPTRGWELPPAIASIVPPALLETPTRYVEPDDVEEDDDERPF